MSHARADPDKSLWKLIKDRQINPVKVPSTQCVQMQPNCVEPQCMNSAQPELCGVNPAGDQQCVALFSQSKRNSLTRVLHPTNPSLDERSSPESNNWRTHRRTLGPLRTSYEIIILVLLSLWSLPLKKATWVCGMQTQLWVKVTCVTLHSTPTSSSHDSQHDLWVRYFYFCIHEKEIFKKFDSHDMGKKNNAALWTGSLYVWNVAQSRFRFRKEKVPSPTSQQHLFLSPTGHVAHLRVRHSFSYSMQNLVSLLSRFPEGLS